jgi:hypothetical protein
MPLTTSKDEKETTTSKANNILKFLEPMPHHDSSMNDKCNDCLESAPEQVNLRLKF